MKLGLVLAGGGIRGAAHVGAIKALEESGIKADVVAGTSAGSIVAALYSMGYTSDEMYELFKKFSKTAMGIGPKYLLDNIKENQGLKIKGIISGINIEKAIEEVAKEKKVVKINDIKMPISIVATDLIQSKKIIFTNSNIPSEDNYVRNINIGTAVRASCSVPGVYTPVEYEKYQLVDGSLFDNLPVEEAKKIGAEKIISIKFKIKNNRKYNTLYNIGMQSIDLMTENLIQESIKQSDILIDLDLKDVKSFNIAKMEFCYEQGYKQTKAQIR